MLSLVRIENSFTLACSFDLWRPASSSVSVIVFALLRAYRAALPQVSEMPVNLEARSSELRQRLDTVFNEIDTDNSGGIMH